MAYDWFNRTGPDPADANQDALEWARLAYARLKAQQEEQKQEQQEEHKEAPPEAIAPPPFPETPSPEPTPVLSLLEQAAAQRAERQQAIGLATPETAAAPQA
ncbi:signal recognition particle-docking protein FtsY, partial [Cyanobium sp. BA20m-p-22]|nr:signal recognition particle-docking protein FtsY [Cyanobium sp. BA20m-p-22]